MTGRRHPQRVVVVGASLAGLFSAAAAAGGGRTVTVLERDTLPDGPRARAGVPQGRHAHVFLHRGLLAVEELLPGFGAELRAAGAVPLDTGHLPWLGEFGWNPTHRKHFEVLSVTRPRFEHVVRDRVRALPGVRIRDGAPVTGLRRGQAGEPPWFVELSDGSAEAADLVVVAAGRASRLPAWLSAAGVRTPTTSQVDARIGYATRVYAVDPDLVAAPGMMLQQTPDRQVGGIALPVEEGRWIVGAVGAGDRRPPRDVTGFSRFLEDLPERALADLTEESRPDGDVVVHRQTGNLRHHYETTRPWPPGLLVVGDALCAFNPIYGQGVTVAACEALALRRALRRGFGRGEERRLLRRFSRIAELPWALATSEDLRYDTSAGQPSRRQQLLGRWSRELARLSAHGDERAHASVARVYHLMASPLLLFHPGLLAAAVRARIRGYGPAAPRPELLRSRAGQPPVRRRRGA